ncbi:MAG: hypothetical protein JW971_01700 [Synergistales bacterium]|nr:hypothetical protein [Synergistales bacterium]
MGLASSSIERRDSKRQSALVSNNTYGHRFMIFSLTIFCLVISGVLISSPTFGSSLYQDVIFQRENEPSKDIPIPLKKLQVSGMGPISNLELIRKIPFSFNALTRTDLVIQKDDKEFQNFLKTMQIYWKIPENRKVKFSWNTEEDGVASALWQVSTLRFSPDNTLWKNPPGLVASGPAPLENRQSGKYPRVFFVDFGTFAPKPPSESSLLIKPEQILKPEVKSVPKLKLKQTTPTLQPQQAPSVQIKPVQGLLDIKKKDPLQTFNMPYYVRVVPLDSAGNPSGIPSEPVTILYGDPINDGSIEFVPSAFEKPDAVLPCVRVMKYIPIQNEAPDAMYHVVAVKDIPDPFGGEPLTRKGQKFDIRPRQDDKSWLEAVSDFFSDVVDWVKGAVNWVSEAYDSIQKAAIDAACSVAGEQFRGAFEMGLNIGMAALGVPPSIPNFDELTEMGVDYLVAVATEQAVGIGVDPAIAKDASEKSIHALQKELEHQANGGGSGSLFKPDPDFYYRPAYMMVEISNNNPQPSHAGTGRIMITVKDGQWDADLFDKVYFRIPSLKPGERISMPIYLKENMENRIEDHGYYDGMQRFWGRYMTPARVTVMSGVYDTTWPGGGPGDYIYDNNEGVWQQFIIQDPRNGMIP